MTKNNYNNFESGKVGEFKVSYMNPKDEKTLNYKMFDRLDDAKAEAKKLMDKDYTVLIMHNNKNQDGTYSWEIMPYADYKNRRYDKWLILTLCIIIIILAVKNLSLCK